jgi:solute carrier family 25 iron transporter 28/37
MSISAQQAQAPLAFTPGSGSSSLLHGMTVVEVIAGGAAGLGEHLCMFPFDTIKTRMQEANRSFVPTLTQMLRKERWSNLYRGCVPVVVAAVPAHGAYFGIYEAAKRAMITRSGSSSDTSRNMAIAVSASCATAAHDFVSVPFDVIKQRMQVDAVHRFPSSLSCFRELLKTEGVASLFRSLPTTVCMNAPQVVCHWIVYETIKKFLIERHMAHSAADLLHPSSFFARTEGEGGGEDENESAWSFILAGLCAGSCAAVVSTPLDNIKTSLQLGQQAAFRESAKSIFRERGLVGFWTGVLPRALYMAPSAAIVMTTYEFTKNALSFLE